NGLFYITYDVTINEGGTNKTFDRVARFGVSQSPPFLADTSTHQALISQLDEADNHNGGDLHFGADGYLYISVGDEGGANDSFDSPTGRMFIADVGQDAWEEIDIGAAGGDFGWSYFEGNHDGPRIASKPGGIAYVAPIYEYAHGTGNFQGNSVTGGILYRGSKFSELFEAYIFCDYLSGRIWALRQSNGTWSNSLLATDAGVVSIGIDP